MLEFDTRYPAYGFARHKGYPVRAHVESLRLHGACPIHRQSFAPVREVLGLPPLPPWPVRTSLRS
jgi:ribonuclease HII